METRSKMTSNIVLRTHDGRLATRDELIRQVVTLFKQMLRNDAVRSSRTIEKRVLEGERMRLELEPAYYEEWVNLLPAWCPRVARYENEASEW